MTTSIAPAPAATHVVGSTFPATVRPWGEPAARKMTVEVAEYRYRPGGRIELSLWDHKTGEDLFDVVVVAESIWDITIDMIRAAGAAVLS